MFINSLISLSEYNCDFSKSYSTSKIFSKSKSNSKKNHIIKSLSILKGGDDENSKEEKKSSFFDFLNKREDKPKDYNASNAPDMDEDKDADKGITFKSSKLFIKIYKRQRIIGKTRKII